MTTVLIPTKPDDAHAIYAKLALEKKGHKGLLWYTADFPQQQKHTFELSKDVISWKATGTDFLINNALFNTVWVRRPRQPVLADSLHPDDKENAVNENAAFFKTFWQVIAPGAFWVNPVNQISAVNCKLQQLHVATEVGLNTPTTVVSNDPDQIKHFIRDHPANEVIYKTLYPTVWLNKNEMRLTYTKEITLAHLPSDEMLQQTPGIFQKKIRKAFELRITYFGDYAISAKLCSQAHPKGVIDWRYAPTQALKVEEFFLPDEVNKKCKKFMKKLGLVFGCFDFIVTPENEYYFLEINEQGQFLWIEEANPKIKMLDAFTDFLIQGSADFNWKKTKNAVSLSDFQSQMIQIQKNAMENHQASGKFF